MSYYNYSRDQLLHLHVDFEQQDTFNGLSSSIKSLQLSNAISRFKNVLSVIFSSENPVSLCNDYLDYTSEHLPADVHRFVSNWLMRGLSDLSNCPDVDTAFDTIFPRHIVNSSDFKCYLDKLNYISEEFVNDSSNPQSSTDEP